MHRENEKGIKKLDSVHNIIRYGMRSMWWFEHSRVSEMDGSAIESYQIESELRKKSRFVEIACVRTS